jgi:hypothetical protein
VSGGDKTTGPVARITSLGSAALHFRIDYEQAKHLPIGKYVQSDVVMAGGHPWRIECFPRGVLKFESGEYLAIYLRHMGKIRSVRAAFEAFLLDRDGQPCSKANGWKKNVARQMRGQAFMNSQSTEIAMIILKTGDGIGLLRELHWRKNMYLRDTSHLYAPSWSYMTTQTIKNYLTALFQCLLQILGLILVAC